MRGLDYLDNLQLQESLIRGQIWAAVSSDGALNDHLSCVQDAMDHLTMLLQVESSPGSNLHTFQLLAMRLFNSGASTIKVGLSGYYQAAFQLLRDTLEVVNLLDLFRIDVAAVTRWVAVSDKKTAKEFIPFSVRQALEKNPEFSGQRRDSIYSTYSDIALHPTYKGIGLMSSSGACKLGPFFDLRLTRALLEDLATHLSHATLAISILIDKDLPEEVLVSKGVFLQRLDTYHGKYIKRQTKV